MLAWPTRVAGAAGECRVSGTLGDIVFRFDAATLPYLQLMHDLRPHSMIVAIEPCTSARLEGGRSGPERMLGPGEKRRYEVGIAFEGVTV